MTRTSPEPASPADPAYSPQPDRATPAGAGAPGEPRSCPSSGQDAPSGAPERGTPVSVPPSQGSTNGHAHSANGHSGANNGHGHGTNGHAGVDRSARNGHTTASTHPANGRATNGHSTVARHRGASNGTAVHESEVLKQDAQRLPRTRAAGSVTILDAPARERVSSAAGVTHAAPTSEAVDWESLSPRGVYARWGKRLLSMVLLVLVLPVAALFCLPITLVNWLVFRDLRQVLYTQPRVGHRGRLFNIYKFRTMRAGEQADFQSWKEGTDDERVTRFGRLLRNTHLDELPQLLNILRGEMTFIGPRPEMVEIHDWAAASIPSFHERHAVRPGITGFAQITQGYAGNDEEAYRQKLVADQYYRRHVTLRFDLEILFRTALWMIRRRGWSWVPQDATGMREPHTI